MTYQALARKWRPQDFSSIIGQDAVTTALRNAIADHRIAQAYLFSGIRGVGKTTAARVLAKALNCERRLRLEREGGAPQPDPCNDCGPCREITIGSDLDVIEIDAATYSKVEQVRELTESLRYGPARDAYKVVVIDEIHRLSRQAFDALLKIVEEPPPHLVFIFATTEIEVVPATILSRCQEFHFRRVSAATVSDHLRRLCEAETIEASDRALRLLARAGEGSVRDSVALLDQLATFGSGRVAEEDAVRLLGGLDLQLFYDLLRAILAGDAVVVTGALARVEDEGWDPRRTHDQFLAYCRDALHAAVGTDPERLDLPAEDAQQLAALAKGAGYENLLRLLNQMLKSEELVRRSETPSLAVEIAWLRAAELPKLIKIEEILAGVATAGTGGAPASNEGRGGRGPLPAAGGGGQRPRGGAAPSGGSRFNRPASTAPARATTAAPREPAVVRSIAPPPMADAANATETSPASASFAAVVDLAAAGSLVEGVATADAAGASQGAPIAPPRLSSDPREALLELVSQRKQPLAARLRDCHALRFENGAFEAVISRGDTWLREAFDRPANREILDAAVRQVWGDSARWRIVEEAAAARAAAPVVMATPPMLDHPVVQSALDLFAGTIETIEESPPREDR